ncbi:LysM peptidoglycan-binding domain-containing protein [Nocardioides sp. R-C-SC26]|uniref:LysM peptidoglycan-binding domain-containing protein n=1 Tax=Nocardioides sp. R-C-SC26 TaxID=2870414 RepID=UPI001E3DB9F6|nr:LysM peptidoglycan-binding domain-containing protein [Nocardioides sp. R-C-SC26]
MTTTTAVLHPDELSDFEAVFAASAARRVPTYRLTRRGRLVVFGFALVMLAAIGIAFASGSMATEEKAVTETIVVAPGDTLWDIAGEAAAVTGTDDVREMMRHIEGLNDLDGVSLAVGQRLIVPTAAQ